MIHGPEINSESYDLEVAVGKASFREQGGLEEILKTEF